MSVEEALIARAKPHLMHARAEALFHGEVSKGCRPEIAPTPVALEPCFRPISHAPGLVTGQVQSDFVPESIPPACDLLRLEAWPSPEEKFSWLSSELFLKQLHTVSHRIGFEIIGNAQKIQMHFLAHLADVPMIKTVFRGQFERCELSESSDNLITGLFLESQDDLSFQDYFPPPPYSHLLTRPDELKVTPYHSLIAALMEVAPPAIGFYQALLQPVKPMHNWHRNIEVLLDVEYTIKLNSGLQPPQRYLQQAPSGDLRSMAWELQTKAHTDKPLYSIAIRSGVACSGKDGPVYLRSLSAFLNLFQHGGRPLNYVTDKEYRQIMPAEKIMEMFILGATYRPGFLVNSEELAGFVHIPPANILEFRKPPISILETLPVGNTDLHNGTPIGRCEYAGIEYLVRIPLQIRRRSTHIIGKTDHCKSTTMARMILDDIDKGMGVAVVDPHGDLIEDLLCLIKEEYIEKIIYLDPGNPDHVPLWNPLKRRSGQDLSRTADNIVAAFKSVVTGWGDRLEHLLRHSLYALLQLSNSTFLDILDLLRRKTEESNRLRKEILEVVRNHTARQFWDNDFDRYSNEALDPPKHKLSKLLVAGTVSRMLSQPENLIDFRRIMDEGMILLVNLSTIGPEVREILGCFILSLLHLTALSRSDTPKKERKQFHIHVDEAHRFITEALEDLIAETRKFSASLTLAHHYLSQFGTKKKIDALSSVGSTIIMNVDTRDAGYLTKDLQNLVKDTDLATLQKGEAIARIGTKIRRVNLEGPLIIPERHFKDAIIERSHRLYYRPAHIVEDIISQRGRRWDRPFSPLMSAPCGPIEEFAYDEF